MPPVADPEVLGEPDEPPAALPAPVVPVELELPAAPVPPTLEPGLEALLPGVLPEVPMPEDPLDEEPLAAPCSRRHFSFSGPAAIASQSFIALLEDELLPPAALGLVVLVLGDCAVPEAPLPLDIVPPVVPDVPAPVALGDCVPPVAPEDPVVPLEDCASAAPESASSAADVAAQISFRFMFVLREGLKGESALQEASGVPRTGN